MTTETEGNMKTNGDLRDNEAKKNARCRTTSIRHHKDIHTLDVNNKHKNQGDQYE